jgi:hypothetical protein
VIAERDCQVAEFKEVNCTVAKETLTKWKGLIMVWVADKSEPNPYYLEGGKSGQCVVAHKRKVNLHRVSGAD